MSMTVISGVVTGYRERADIRVNQPMNPNSNVPGQIHVRVDRTSSFRIGSRAVYMDTAPNLVNGDLVTAPLWMLLLCFMSVAAGLFCAILMGPILAIGGVWNYLKAIPIKGAIALLRATPRPAPVQ